MKIILSRKGFDSSAGGVASPIIDGTMLSLPIPDRTSAMRYEQITLHGHNLGKVVADLTKAKKNARYGAHLDPDLVSAAQSRDRGWLPLFGQAGAAQKVLERAGVGKGDLFLFFGWYREAELHGGSYRFVKKAPNVHAIWGWMQVESVLNVADDAMPAWARYHPHVAAPGSRKNNTLYVAAKKLDLPGASLGLPGAGVMGTYDDRLCLTAPGKSRTNWILPGWLKPTKGRPALGSHGDAGRWKRTGDRVHLRSVARGQEFVLDADHYPEALGWAKNLLTGTG